ncbi:TolB-like protein/DNA-binding winged helix-turn-helix (wHTH) protein [Labrenzia sp. EL_159]|nr:TolB-like protein/DNA-binding winged helix-turn-helix (wHTH) protein [Labrenzia sp. EL_162]MBG6196973.1 TolB-like protein/DNA-binding winged helix-turn-helix (wHTH) protein [Labrenzia sp. EL_159]
MDDSQRSFLMLGSVRFDRGARRLIDAQGQDLPLRPQSLAVLGVLANNKGETVSKNDLIASAWGATHVTDDSLIQCIADIRRAIGDEGHSIIQTVPRVGYKLVPTQPEPETASRVNSRWLLPASALAVLVVIALVATWMALLRPSGMPSRPSIAVLPFEHISDDQSQAFFTDGVSKSITTNLSRFEGLFVVSSYSAFQYRSSKKLLKEIASDLGVRYLLTGDVQPVQEQLLITAQLTDTSDGKVVWAEEYTLSRSNVLAVQNELSSRIATTLVQRVELATSQWARSVTPEDLTAYELVLRSEPPPVDRDGLNAANELLDRAIALSPDFTLAHSLKAKNDLLLWRHSLAEDLDEALRQARSSAARAIALDNSSYQAYHALSQIDLYADQDHTQALANLAKGLEINPNDADMMVRMATLLGFMNRDKEALDWIERAVRQNPYHPVWYHWNAAFVLEVAGEHEKAIVASKKALAVYQTSASIRRILIAAHGHLGQWEEAERYTEEILKEFPDFRLSSHMRNSPFMDPVEKSEYWELFRKAGLPD